MKDRPKKLYQTLPKDDPHYASVGRVACMWAVLESFIDGAIANLAGSQVEVMTCVTAQLIGPAKRMDALIALFKHRGGSDATRRALKTLQGRLQQLGEDRNRVVHDPLCIEVETGQIHRMIATAKGELKFSVDPISKDQIDKVGDDILGAVHDFEDLAEKLRAEIYEPLLLEIERSRAARRARNPPDGSPSGSVPPA